MARLQPLHLAVKASEIAAVQGGRRTEPFQRAELGLQFLLDDEREILGRAAELAVVGPLLLIFQNPFEVDREYKKGDGAESGDQSGVKGIPHLQHDTGPPRPCVRFLHSGVTSQRRGRLS